MVFRRRRRAAEAVEETVAEEPGEDVSAVEPSAEPAGEADEPDLAALDTQDWRARGPWDVSEVDLDEEPPDGSPRIDLGSLIVTGFPGAELRLQVSEETQQVVSAMLIGADSALELGAYAAPRSGGLWPELRAELVDSATEAGGSVALVEGPFGVELRRIQPVRTPDGQEGYQPSRMWVVEGPRWMLRGILYGQAALSDGVEPPVAELLDAFRRVIVRRGDHAMAPGDLLPLQLPQGLAAPGGDAE